MKIKQINPKKELYRLLFDSFDNGEIVFPILGKSKDCYNQAFVYFFRRFGASISGSDPDKELVRYMLQTHKKGYFLNVGFTSLGNISFTLYTDIEAVAREFHAETWQVSKRYRQERDVWLAENGLTHYETFVDEAKTPEAYQKLNNAYHTWQKENGYRTEEKLVDENTQKLFLRYIATENARVTKLCPIEMLEDSEFQFPIRDEAILILTNMAKDFLNPTSIRDTDLNILGKFESKKSVKYYEPYEHSGNPYSVNKTTIP